MPWHLQDRRDRIYANPACGASYLSGGTTGPDSGIEIDCDICKQMLTEVES